VNISAALQQSINHVEVAIERCRHQRRYVCGAGNVHPSAPVKQIIGDVLLARFDRNHQWAFINPIP